MRYRALSSTGDYTWGQGSANFLVNSPACVAQAVQTRLALDLGEWYLNTTDGTPYATEILGTGTMNLYDVAVQARILGTPGVQDIQAGSYSSTLNPATRALTIRCTIDTVYGAAEIAATLSPQ